MEGKGEKEGGTYASKLPPKRKQRERARALRHGQRREHGEVRREEGRGPADLGEDEDDDLEDDEQPVHDGPEDACRLVRDGATSEDAAT